MYPFALQKFRLFLHNLENATYISMECSHLVFIFKKRKRQEFYLFERQSARKSRRKRDKKSFYLLIHLPKGCNVQAEHPRKEPKTPSQSSWAGVLKYSDQLVPLSQEHAQGAGSAGEQSGLWLKGQLSPQPQHWPCSLDILNSRLLKAFQCIMASEWRKKKKLSAFRRFSTYENFHGFYPFLGNAYAVYF